MNYTANKAVCLLTDQVPLSFHCTEDQIDIEVPRPAIKVLIGYLPRPSLIGWHIHVVSACADLIIYFITRAFTETISNTK